jgi:uncharacterized membrane protein YeiH
MPPFETAMMPDSPVLPAAVDLAGIAIFAFSGALVAARMRQTFVTMSFFALVTGVGGGTVRDLLIGAPVFWMHDPLVAAICLAAAFVAWFTPVAWWQGRLLEWADALGLAGYAVFGTLKAMNWGVPMIPAMLMGVVTGCAGGIIRDVVAGLPSILMRPELYVSAAALAAVTAGGLTGLGVSSGLAGFAGAVAGLALRIAAIQWNLALPAHRGSGGGDDRTDRTAD